MLGPPHQMRRGWRLYFVRGSYSAAFCVRASDTGVILPSDLALRAKYRGGPEVIDGKHRMHAVKAVEWRMGAS